MIHITIEARDALADAIERLGEIRASGETLARLAGVQRELAVVLAGADERTAKPRKIRAAGP